jgi:hypothetical protein
MPQPTQSQVHIDAALTQIATAYLQDDSVYIADKVFPAVPVEHQSDKYFKYRKGDFFRDEAQLRADATESAGTGFNLDTGSYLASVWALHQDIGEQLRSNADPSVDPGVAATKMLMQKMLIKRDRQFVSKYLTTGVWGTDITGAASGNGTTTATYWSDDANGDPFTDISNGVTTMLQNTGYEPNVLTLAFPVYQALRKHPLVIDRIKYTSPAYAGKITPQLLAEAFDIERLVVSKAVYNSAAEGATDSFAFVAPKSALLTYAAPSPGLMVPSAGYVFPWKGFTGLNNMGVRVSTIPLPWLGLGTERTEAEMSFDMQVVGSDLGYYFSGIVQ